MQDSIVLREEIPNDISHIHSLTEAAFRDMPYAGGDEQDVIDRLRDAGALTLSMVALFEGKIVGQITFSPATSRNGADSWLALGPVSVMPEFQGRGIGSRLIENGLARFRQAGYKGCILTGNPDYYCRFGFEKAPQNAPANEPAEYFQLISFTGSPTTATFEFHPAFYG